MEYLMENGKCFLASCLTLCCFVPPEVEEDVIVFTDVPLATVVPLTLLKPEDTPDWTETPRPCSGCLGLQESWCAVCWEDWCDSQCPEVVENQSDFVSVEDGECSSEDEDSEDEIEEIVSGGLMVVENQSNAVVRKVYRFDEDTWEIIMSYLKNVEETVLFQQAEDMYVYYLRDDLDFNPYRFYYQNQIHCHTEAEVAKNVIQCGIWTAADNAVRQFVKDTGFIAVIELTKDKYLTGRIERIKKMCDLPPVFVDDPNDYRVYAMIQANNEQGIYKTEKRKTKAFSASDSLLRKIGKCYVLNAREFELFTDCGRNEEYAYSTQVVELLNRAGFSVVP
jgi:hypothetical protein